MRWSKADQEAVDRAAPGVKRRHALEMRQRAEWLASPMPTQPAIPAPTWQEVEGVRVRRIGDSPIVAVPGAKRGFCVIDLRDRRDAVCSLTKGEVDGWLRGAWERERS